MVSQPLARTFDATAEQRVLLHGVAWQRYETRQRFPAGGSTPFRKAAKSLGLEPDECYCLGAQKEFPDLAVEVVITSGLVDKLDTYKGLGVTEGWVWQSGQFSIDPLYATDYALMETSELLPELDIALLASHVKPEEPWDVVIAFREAIR